MSPFLQREKNHTKPGEQSKMLANHRSGAALPLYLNLQTRRVFSQLPSPIHFPEQWHSLGKILDHTHQHQNVLFSDAVRFYDLHP